MERPWPAQEGVEAEADAEAVRAIQLAVDTLLRAVDSTAEHLSYWESLHKDTPGRRLRAVFMRRGPLPFAQSFAMLLSDSLSTPPLALALPVSSFTSYLLSPPQSLSHAAALARDLLAQSYSRVLAAARSLSERVKKLSANGAQPDHPTSASTSTAAGTADSQGLQGSEAQHLRQPPPRHRQSEAFASAFVTERVRLLRALKLQLLTALGEMWEASSLPGSPPVVSLDALAAPSYSRSESSNRRPAALPSYLSRHALQDMVRHCCKALEGLEGKFDLPQERHGPFKTTTGSWSLAADSFLLLRFSSPPGNSQMDTEAGDRELGGALHSLRHQARQLDLFVTMLLAHYKRPTRAQHMWMEYTAMGLGAVLATSMVAKHRGTLAQWCVVAREASTTFVAEHVWQPMLAVRDDLFLTFRPQRTSIVDSADVQQTADSLHRHCRIADAVDRCTGLIVELVSQLCPKQQMLVAFVASSRAGTGLLLKGSGEGARLVTDGGQGGGSGQPSTSALMAVLVQSYEKEVMRPLQGLVAGHLAQALLIQTQQMKLHVESALLEMEKILRANAINFAFLAALPALLLSFAAARLTRDWLLSQSRGAEGRGRAAQTARRLLMGQVERLVLEQLQEASTRVGGGGRGHELQGRLVYALARLYRSVKREAQRTGEWSSLELDIVDVSRPNMDAQVKAALAARMGHLYECLTLSPQRLLSVR